MVFAILLGKLWGGKIQTSSERQRPPSAAPGPGLGTSGPCDLHTPTASTSAAETAPDFGVTPAKPPAPKLMAAAPRRAVSRGLRAPRVGRRAQSAVAPRRSWGWQEGLPSSPRISRSSSDKSWCSSTDFISPLRKSSGRDAKARWRETCEPRPRPQSVFYNSVAQTRGARPSSAPPQPLLGGLKNLIHGEMEQLPRKAAPGSGLSQAEHALNSSWWPQGARAVSLGGARSAPFRSRGFAQTALKKVHFSPVQIRRDLGSLPCMLTLPEQGVGWEE